MRKKEKNLMGILKAQTSNEGVKDGDKDIANR